MPDGLTDQQWDAIIIGTGIGGASAARRLSELGLSVLMLEKGPNLDGTQTYDQGTEIEDPDQRLNRGQWPQPLQAVIDGRAVRIDGMLGACVGGTSTYYAATLERPEPHDLDNQPARPHPTGGWPVGYGEMQPYFDLAEARFRISGEIDPLSQIPAPSLRPARPFSSVDSDLRASFQRAALHPYQTHIAAEFPADCAQCFGRRCPRLCKMEGRSAGVLPALATGNAHLIDRCTVTRIEANHAAVTRVHCRRDGQEFTVSGRAYVLAGGGIASPSLLLRSRNEDWPDGLGNRHDLVGRNLMFHLSEMLAIWPEHRALGSQPSRALSLRDLYFIDGQRFGLIQSMGIDADLGLVLQSLRQNFDASRLRHLRPLRPFLRLLPRPLMRVLGPAKIFVGVLEDLPYAENRVTPRLDDIDSVTFNYTIKPELHARRKAFRAAMGRAFAAHRHIFLTQAPNLNFAHPCGTLRFGDDPRTSVLDRDCRMHGVANLYVADSSFMPTSNGSNPSLTIAANAYRVADRLAARLTGGR